MTFPLKCCGIGLLFAFAIPSYAEEISVSRRILDSQTVDLGVRSITYNRVETPVLKPQPSFAPSSPPFAFIPPTAEELAALRAWEAKSDVLLFLSCTVFEHQMTEVRWWRDDGEYVVWSGIDFNYLRSLFDFETEATRYTVLLGIGDASWEDFRAWNAAKQRRPAFPYGASSSAAYQMVSFPKTGIDPEAKAAFDAIHAYFAAHRERLIWNYEESERSRAAQEAWLKAHPPQPKNTTVYYFPIRSSAKHSPKEVR